MLSYGCSDTQEFAVLIVPPKLKLPLVVASHYYGPLVATPWHCAIDVWAAAFGPHLIPCWLTKLEKLPLPDNFMKKMK